jgi:hypothetical protein
MRYHLMLTDAVRICKHFLLTSYRDVLNINHVQLCPFMVVSAQPGITQMTIRLFLKNKNLNDYLDLSIWWQVMLYYCWLDHRLLRIWLHCWISLFFPYTSFTGLLPQPSVTRRAPIWSQNCLSVIIDSSLWGKV